MGGTPLNPRLTNSTGEFPVSCIPYKFANASVDSRRIYVKSDVGIRDINIDPTSILYMYLCTLR